jgi:hypothetical protein
VGLGGTAADLVYHVLGHDLCALLFVLAIGKSKKGRTLMPGFGRLRATDTRDKKFPMRALLRPTGYPNHRYYFIPNAHMPLDQGQTGTCTAHAAVGFLYAAPIVCKNPESPFDLYRETVANDEFTDNDAEATLPDADLQMGTSVRATVKTLQRHGHIKTYVWAGNADDGAAWLLTGRGPLMAGTDWTYGMSELDAKGYARVVGGVQGGHAYLIQGYDRVRKAFRAINSWGYDWGQKGRFWIAHPDMQKLLDAGGELCAATEQLVPKDLV